MKLSIIIPAYNEEERIERTLKKIIKYLKKRNISNDIIVVDDGSTDKTREIVNKFKCIKLTKKRENKGKGYSVKQGMLIAKNDYFLLTDADLSTPIEELDKFLKSIDDHDIIIGSRALEGSDIKNKWYKVFLGRGANLLISFLLVKGIKDTQCGFKLYKKEVARELFNKQTIDRFGFDFEILYLAQKLGYNIKEQPVKWINDTRSKITMMDYPKTFLELFKVRFNELKGKYNN